MTMSCRTVRRLLPLHVGSDLDFKHGIAVDAHLDSLPLDAETRAKIEASVARTVARVTTKSRAEYESMMTSRERTIATEAARRGNLGRAGH